MKKIVLALLAVLLLLPLSAVGQKQDTKTAKAMTIYGRVSDDGKSLVAKSGEPWLVTNPVTLAGHEKQQVKVKCETSADHSIRVISVKIVATPATYRFNPNDSAFRR